jgi:phytoene dehydrogenase-like protein
VRLLALSADQPPLTFWGSAERTAEELRAVSTADADAYVRFDEHVRAVAGFLGRLNSSTPPRLDRPHRDGAGDAVGLGRAFRGLGTKRGRELTRALPMAVADLVGEWFESDRVRAALAARGTRFTAMGPWSAGTALVLLNDSAGNDGGAAGESVLATGLAEALAAAATEAGVEIRTGATIEAITAPDGRVAGVTLEGGEQLWAPIVAATVDPKTVLTHWIDPVVAGPQLRWRAGNIRTPGRTARVTLELSALPEFTGVTDPAQLSGRILTAPGIDALEQAFDASKYGEMSEQPMIEAVIPTALDAGAESHRLEALVQWVPPGTTTRMVGDRTVRELERHAPGIKGLVTGRTVLTPDGLEAEYGLAGGHVFHGELALDQFFAWRPAIGLARHRLAIPGLYLCGSGAHPGGGLTGLPGAHAAKAILADA